MKTIWKYPLEITDEQVVAMPNDAEILTVQMQGSELCLWAVVEDTNPKEPRTICIIGTGNPMPDERFLIYIGTAQMGPLVWHVFEKT